MLCVGGLCIIGLKQDVTWSLDGGEFQVKGRRSHPTGKKKTPKGLLWTCHPMATQKRGNFLGFRGLSCTFIYTNFL